ncbi:MAG: site-specific integrase [Actinomycetota bacterium]|nr:site-specific integrase [Actinomycetota bacterium]
MAQYIVYTAEGRKRKTLYGKTRADVTKKLDRPLSDRESGLVFDDKGLTVEEYLDWWLKNSDRDTVRNTTYERYKEIIGLHIAPALGRLELMALTPAHVQGLYRDRLDRGLSAATVQKMHVVLHKALDQPVRWSLVPGNVTDAVKAPRPTPTEIRLLDQKQAKALVEAARGDSFEAHYILAATTGMRQGELLGFK